MKTNTKQIKTVRQGDVLLRAVDKIPGNTNDIAAVGDKNILAYGEVTGHKHFVPASDARFVINEQAQRFLQVEKKTALRHDTHFPIELPIGNYEVIIQREYDGEYSVPVVD